MGVLLGLLRALLGDDILADLGVLSPLVHLVGGGRVVAQWTDLILLLTPQQTAVGVLCPSDVVNLAE